MEHLYRADLFFSGLYCFFNFPECQKIWPDKDKDLWNRYTELSRDEIAFYNSLNDKEQKQLLDWYNAQVDKDDINIDFPFSDYKITMNDIAQSISFYLYVSQNIDQLCTKIWKEDSAHFIQKWYGCYERKAWSFFSGLDQGNQIKLYTAYIKNKLYLK